MSNTKERLEKLEKGIKEVEVLNEKLKELEIQNKRIKEKEMELLNLQIKNKEKEIKAIRQSRIKRYKGNLIPKGHVLKNSRGQIIDRID